MLIDISSIIQKNKNYLPIIPIIIAAIIISLLSYFVIVIALNIIILYLIFLGFSVSSSALLNMLALILFLNIGLGSIGYRGHRGQKYLNDKFVQKNEYIHGNCDNEYSAILIGNNTSWLKKLHIVMSIRGVKYLEKSFENTNKDYKIYQKISEPIFNTVISDHKCQELYILGHGSKGTFTISTNKTKNDCEISYIEYKDKPKKRIIAQLHCASIHHGINNESLVDLLAIDKNNSYVANGYILFISVCQYCAKMLKISK